MYMFSKSDFVNHSLSHNGKKIELPHITDMAAHTERINRELKQLGVSSFGMIRMETRYLPNIIHPDEHLGGVIYGRGKEGFAMIVATDRRIIYLDKKPLFVNQDEITYFVVSGVSYSQTGIAAAVVLHTRIRDYGLRTFNKKCADNFVEYIESRCLEQEMEEIEHHDKVT